MSDPTRAWVELDQTALIHNLKRARLGHQAKVMAVVKANAYGHGLRLVAKTLESQVEALAVATLQEGIELRVIIPTLPIVCLSGFYTFEQIQVFKQYNITLVVFNLEQINYLQDFGGSKGDIWLKIDTGMGRLGIDPAALEHALSRLHNLGYQASLMSHFASADRPDSKNNETQHQCFSRLTQPLSLRRSFANSAAILTRPQDHYDMIRPGIMLYGSSPIDGQGAQNLGLRPAMKFCARLINIKTIAAGQSVGYAAKWRATKPCQVGIVSAGYADGYPRVITADAQVAIAGKRYNIIGRVSMDTLAILLRDNHPHRLNDIVELWGTSISVDEVARWANTLAYELLCKITSRVKRLEVS